MQSYIIIRKSIYHYTQVPYIIIRKCRKCRSGRAVPIKMSLAHNTAAAVESLPVRVSGSVSLAIAIARQWLHGPRLKYRPASRPGGCTGRPTVPGLS